MYYYNENVYITNNKGRWIALLVTMSHRAKFVIQRYGGCESRTIHVIHQKAMLKFLFLFEREVKVPLLLLGCAHLFAC
jgi:hypothetical protein